MQPHAVIGPGSKELNIRHALGTMESADRRFCIHVRVMSMRQTSKVVISSIRGLEETYTRNCQSPPFATTSPFLVAFYIYLSAVWSSSDSVCPRTRLYAWLHLRAGPRRVYGENVGSSHCGCGCSVKGGGTFSGRRGDERSTSGRCRCPRWST